MSDASTLHFVRLTSKSLSRLTALVEEAAALLDRPGGRRLRHSIVSEAQLAIGSLRAADNSILGFGFDGVACSTLLDREWGRVVELKRQPRAKRPLPAHRHGLHVVGGTDTETG